MRISSKTAARGAVIGAVEAILGTLESYLHSPIPISEFLVPTSYIKGIGKGAIVGTTIGKTIAYTIGPPSPYKLGFAIIDIPLTIVNSSIAYIAGKYKLKKFNAIYWPVFINSLGVSFAAKYLLDVPPDFWALQTVSFLLLAGLQGIPQYLMLKFLEKRIKE